MVVLKPLKQERLGWFRRMYGLTAVNVKHVRPLRDRRDAFVCEWLNVTFENTPYGDSRWARVYYKADGYYFVSLVDRTDPAVGRAVVPRMMVLDSRLKPIAEIAPKVLVSRPR